MKPLTPPRPGYSPRRWRTYRLAFLALASFCGVACQRTTQNADPQLKPIQEMLKAQVPAGTPEGKVRSFLESRGYPVQPQQRPGTTVATIPSIQAETGQTISARVTFYFDANGKLNTFELQRTTSEPKPQ